jgi:hypothetical protein
MGTLSVAFSLFGDDGEVSKSINVLEAITSNTRRSEVRLLIFPLDLQSDGHGLLKKRFLQLWTSI